MKRTVFIMLTIALLVAALAVSAAAAQTSGVCGDNLTWELTNAQLTISGTGPMYDYGLGESPWFDFDTIKKVVIGEGVTSIGDYAFARTDRYSEYELPSTITRIGSGAFLGARYKIWFWGPKPEMAEDVFRYGRGDCTFFYGWEEEDLQNYLGSTQWYQLILTQAPERKNLYAVNEPIRNEDLIFTLKHPSYNWSRTYIPEEFVADPYDNSVPGEKIVIIQVMGQTFEHCYFVTDGTSHLEAVRVTVPAPMRYTSRALQPKPDVLADYMHLTENVDYRLTYSNNVKVGANAQVTVTGIGAWAGFSKTVSFGILKYDISQDVKNITIFDCKFNGKPQEPKVNVQAVIKNDHTGRETRTLTLGVDYVMYYENNINIGTATYHIVGIGNYCGGKTGTFQITNTSTHTMSLKGAYIGQADGELDQETYEYAEITIAPGIFNAMIDPGKRHIANYELYKAVDEQWQLVDSQMNEKPRTSTYYSYNFSSVYEKDTQVGGAVYMLSYSWVDTDYAVYTGVCVLLVPAKVPTATQMEIVDVMEAANYRYAYLSAYGLDGELGPITWTSSNPSVATVENGIVTMLKTGKFTLTASSGSLSESVEVTVLPEELYRGEILRYIPGSNVVTVYYDGYILQEGKNYTKSVTVQGEETVVTVTGIGVFTGQMVRHFDAKYQPVGHSHGFENLCNAHCISCDYERTTVHTHTRWYRDAEKHWHKCDICGEITEETAHSFDPEQEDVCTVCGPMNVAGDLDGDYYLDVNDAIYLLQHVLMPSMFPVSANVDYDKSGAVDVNDAIYLLQHVLMPGMFPL
jgi:hypothetical protein